MRHVLTSFLALHWALVFAVLAIACVLGGGNGVVSAFQLLAMAIPPDGQVLTGPVPEAVFAIAFAIVSILFCWGLVSALLGSDTTCEDCDDIFRLAFGAAAGVLSVTLLSGTLLGAPRPVFTVAAHLAALIASYVAIHLERWTVLEPVAARDQSPGAVARIMAVEARRDSMLSRLSGRMKPRLGEGI